MTTPIAGDPSPTGRDLGTMAAGAMWLLFKAHWQSGRGRTLALIAAILINGLVPLASVLTAAEAIGGLPLAVAQGPGSDQARHVELAMLGLGVLFLLQQLARAVQGYVAELAGTKLEDDLRARVMAAAAAPATVAHLDDPAIVDLIAQAATVHTARYGPRSATTFGVTGIAGLVTGFSMAALLATLHWWMALVVAGTWLVVRRQVLREAWAIYQVVGFQTAADRRGGYFRDLALTPAAAKEIRLFGLSPWITSRFQEHWDAAMSPIFADRKRALAPTHWLGLLVFVVHAVLLIVIVRTALSGDLGLRDLAVLVQAILAVAILGDGGRDEVCMTWGSSTIPAVGRLEKALQDRASAAPARTTTPPLLAQEIRLEGVRFRYPAQTSDVFPGLDLVLPAGRSLALVGHNGAGKTTMVKLLTGLLDPTEGRILVDGLDLREADPVAWQAQVSVVFQDFVHYEMSLRDNICLTPMPGDDELAIVLEQSGLRDVLPRLPHGLDTILSSAYDAGVSLSGGEWQRVALARALWGVRQGARLLVLDEPTANLDVRAEADFYGRFFELTHGTTSVVISHRFSTVRQADCIVVIDEGAIVEAGSHDELLVHDGLYARMFRAQAAAFAVGSGDA